MNRQYKKCYDITHTQMNSGPVSYYFQRKFVLFKSSAKLARLIPMLISCVDWERGVLGECCARDFNWSK